MTYDPHFYEIIRPGCQSSAAAVVPALHDLFRPTSVVDFGCGEGWWLHEFKKLGCRVLGIDGPYVEARPGLTADEFVAGDLSRAVHAGATGRFDMAVSLEVAEHLPVEAADTFVASLVEAAPVVVFSAAIPGQGGVGHVNEQWPDYWAAKFRDHGYFVSGALRLRLWNMDAVENWYRQNLLVFADPDWVDRPETDPKAVDLFFCPEAEPFRLVHPVLWSYHRGLPDQGSAQ